MAAHSAPPALTDGTESAVEPVVRLTSHGIDDHIDDLPAVAPATGLDPVVMGS